MLKRKGFDEYINKTYGSKSEYPWAKYSSFAVYRHNDNQKWFAVIMTLPKSKFGFKDDGLVDVVNLKCDPLIIGSVRMEEGIFPAYHMNKAYWISVFLDGSVDDEKLKMLLDMSFNLTKKPAKNK